ncbi:class I SAM-dependent methyltransferase [Bacillus sp. JRC01]|nr:class I SAM-dependent methyltransferase [Bacillus sp. JRC01]
MPTYGKNLFKGAAGYYAVYRPVYPSTLIRTLIDEFSLDGEGNILDLGCGPGTMTVRLADWAERTVGIDTEPEMIQEAERIHSMIRNGQVEWFAGTWAEYKMTNPHRFKLVTIAKAFHWMDRDAILEDLYDRIEAGGGVSLSSTIMNLIGSSSRGRRYWTQSSGNGTDRSGEQEIQRTPIPSSVMKPSSGVPASPMKKSPFHPIRSNGRSSRSSGTCTPLPTERNASSATTSYHSSKKSNLPLKDSLP